MFIVVSGPSGVGKSFVVDHFCRKFNFKTVIPYTTRASRHSESESCHYHFRSFEEIQNVSKNFSEGYWCKAVGDDWYGYTKRITEAIKSNGKWIIQAATPIALEIKKHYPNIFIVFLDFEHGSVFERRLVIRTGNNQEQMDNRRKHAEVERSSSNKFQVILKSDDPEELVEDVVKSIQAHLGVCISASYQQAGPLSDSDVLESLKSDSGIKIYGLDEAELEKRVKGWSIDLTLSNSYYRVKRKYYDRIFDLAYRYENDVMDRFVEKKASESEGIFMRPGEFILASSAELLQLPSGIVGLVSGRSSYSRLGISVELSQVIIQPGHNDLIPLQITNNLPYPVIIYPKMLIAQVVFFRTISDSERNYSTEISSKYKNKMNDKRTRFYEDEVFKDVREQSPKKQKTDWDFILNVLLALFAWTFIAAMFAKEILPEQWTASAGSITLSSFIIGTAIAIIRMIKLIISAPKK
jgi:dCTP deaminase